MNIEVVESGFTVIVSTVGVQGPMGLRGNDGSGSNFYPLIGNPSGFITSGQTGAFGGGATPTGQLTGVFYPLSGNPLGYITGLNTGNFITNTQTGVFAIPTGNLTGVFYPLISNPLSYVTASQTGVFNALVTYNLYVSGTQDFTTNIPTGTNNFFVQFPINFLSIPKVTCALEITGNIIYTVNIQGRSVSGFHALFSNFIGESGVILNTHATTN